MSPQPLMPIIDALLAVAGKLRRFDGEFESTDTLHAELLDCVRRLMAVALWGDARGGAELPARVPIAVAQWLVEQGQQQGAPT